MKTQHFATCALTASALALSGCLSSSDSSDSSDDAVNLADNLDPVTAMELHEPDYDDEGKADLDSDTDAALAGDLTYLASRLDTVITRMTHEVEQGLDDLPENEEIEEVDGTCTSTPGTNTVTVTHEYDFDEQSPEEVSGSGTFEYVFDEYCIHKPLTATDSGDGRHVVIDGSLEGETEFTQMDGGMVAESTIDFTDNGLTFDMSDSRGEVFELTGKNASGTVHSGGPGDGGPDVDGYEATSMVLEVGGEEHMIMREGEVGGETDDANAYYTMTIASTLIEGSFTAEKKGIDSFFDDHCGGENEGVDDYKEAGDRGFVEIEAESNPDGTGETLWLDNTAPGTCSDYQLDDKMGYQQEFELLKTLLDELN